jgi:head-tail adaptor
MPRTRLASGRVASGERRQYITLQKLGDPVPDGGGGYTEAPEDLDPPGTWAAMQAATAQDLERMAVGTVIASASHIVTIPFHPEVTTETLIAWTDPARRTHTANVKSVNNPDQRCIELVLVCEEVVA